MKNLIEISQSINNQTVKEEVKAIEDRINALYKRIVSEKNIKSLNKFYIEIINSFEGLEKHSFYFSNYNDLLHAFKLEYQCLLVKLFFEIKDEKLMVETFKKLPLYQASEETIDSLKERVLSVIKDKDVDLSLIYNTEKFDDGNKSENIDDLDSLEFEELCINLLKDTSYIDVKHTLLNEDPGVDIIAYKNGKRYAFQCKCYMFNVDLKPVEDLVKAKATYQYDIGVIITNRYLTEEAKEFALKNEIKIIDRDELHKLLNK